MNPAPVFDRVYAGMKEILREGAIPPGERLDPATLAERLVASITPVRDALHRLVGERMVEAGSEGFAVPKASEPDLRDLYAWNAQFLRIALQSSLSSTFRYRTDEGPAPVAVRAERLFTAIAMRSSNREHALGLCALNDRLHAVRLLEPAVVSADEAEIRAMEQADIRGLRALLGTYHRRRIAAVPQLIRALYRGQD